jgi:hypothetical protein
MGGIGPASHISGLVQMIGMVLNTRITLMPVLACN